MKNYFSYNDGKDIVPDNHFRISPSQLSKFFDTTSQWYHEHLLGEAGFQGNTATHLGNCVHAAAEMYVDRGTIDYSIIDQYIASINDSEIDKDTIIYQYPYMVQALLDQFLIPNSRPAETELFLYKKLLPGIGVGGSIDRYDNNRITDYKTMGSLDKARLPKSFPRSYYFQQLAYAWLLTQHDKPVDFMQLVYVTRSNTGRFNDKGKPLKDYPSEVHILVEPVTTDSLDFIESVLTLMAESVHAWNTQPTIRHLLAQDMRLKVKNPIRFT